MKKISNFSPKVHFRKDSNMSSIIIFALVLLAYTNACLEGKYRCHEELRLIDCTAVGLYSMPHATSTLDNYTSILLRDNYLKHLNFTSLFKVLPPRFQPILLQSRFQPPTKQKQLRIIRCHLTLNQASQEISLHISPHKAQEWNLVHLSADCNSDHSTSNSNFISINHSMLEIKTLTAPTIGNAQSVTTKCRRRWGG